MITLFYTLGNSDICIDGNIRLNDFRNITKQVWEGISGAKGLLFNRGISFYNPKDSFSYKLNQTEKKFEKLEFRMIDALLSCLIKDKKYPEKIVLFATEQDPLHKQDTIYLASIVQYYFNKKYKIHSERIIIEKIKDNPSDMEKMMQYFARYVEDKDQEISTNLYNILQLSAGTSQMNMSLAHQMMIKRGVEYYYIDRLNQDQSIARKDNVFDFIHKRNVLNVINELLSNYEYDGVFKVIEHLNYNVDNDFRCLLQVTSDRKNFAVTEDTVNTSRNLVSDFDYYYKDFRKLFKFIRGLYQNEIVYCFAEFYYQISSYFEKAHFNQGVALIFSLFDNIRQYLFEKITGIKIKVDNGICKELAEFIEKDQDLNKEIEKSKLDKYKPTSVVLGKIIKYFSDKNEIAKMYNNIRKKLEPVERLRNNGPFAHGMDGLNEKNIIRVYEGGIEMLLKDIKEFLEAVDVEIDTDLSYNGINKFLMKLIKTEIN